MNTGIPKSHPRTGRVTFTPLTRTQKAQAQADIAKQEAKMRAIEADINHINMNVIPNENKLLEDALNNITENKQITISHNKDLKQSLEHYRESLISQNRGRLGMVEEQAPNETNEEYLQRMKDLEAEQFDMDLYNEKSALEQIIILKKNLRNLFNKDSLIENITKSFKPTEIFIINKHFTSIQDYFLDNYGRNNINLDLKDIVEVITRIIEKILNPVLCSQDRQELPV
jgi:hypothetical protein